ncbi:hypothetical protein Droror1_Dr00008620 [Drosera rotundifolia]
MLPLDQVERRPKGGSFSRRKRRPSFSIISVKNRRKMGFNCSILTSLVKYSFLLFIIVSTNLVTLFLTTSNDLESSCLVNFQAKTISIAELKISNQTQTTGPTLDSLDKPGVDNLPSELVTFAYGQKLPFGYNPFYGTDTIYSPIGLMCARYKSDIQKYMSYDVNGSCPNDETVAQKLLLKGCEPLPRRRCHPAAASEYDEPIPYPQCQWTTPPDSSVVWKAYSCKNYTCLVNRRLEKGSDDCKDCFWLDGLERYRWLPRRRPIQLEFTLDEVLALKKRGTVRIGLDIGGGAGTFAVRMSERNITIVTTSMNFNAPFNNFIASRGVIPMFITISQRLPFFDNTLDIVHSMHVISNWIPPVQLQFLLFDIYRVLRPGGLFWLDRFFCEVTQWKVIYKPMIESIGFEKKKWVKGWKLDQPTVEEIYLSAVLQKPLQNSWRID